MSDIINPVELTSELIRCESITPISDGSIDLIISYLEPLGFTCTKIDFGEGNEKVENLYAKFGNLEPNICFGGHVDVVPTGDIGNWSINPFGGDIKEGKIWGRGAAAPLPHILPSLISPPNGFMDQFPISPVGTTSTCPPKQMLGSKLPNLAYKFSTFSLPSPKSIFVQVNPKGSR